MTGKNEHERQIYEEDIATAFTDSDENHSNSLDKAEFRGALGRLRIHKSEGHANSLFGGADRDADGFLSKEDFAAVVRSLQPDAEEKAGVVGSLGGEKLGSAPTQKPTGREKKDRCCTGVDSFVAGKASSNRGGGVGAAPSTTRENGGAGENGATAAGENGANNLTATGLDARADAVDLAFSGADADRSGSLNRTEFRSALHTLGVVGATDMEKINTLFGDGDTNGDGTMSKEEYELEVRPMLRISAAFTAADTDSTDSLSLGEFRSALSALNISVEDDLLGTLFTAADKNNDERLSKEEFMTLAMKKLKAQSGHTAGAGAAPPTQAVVAAATAAANSTAAADFTRVDGVFSSSDGDSSESLT